MADDEAYGRQFRAASVGEVDGERWPMTRIMREFCRPEIRLDAVADGLTRLTDAAADERPPDPRARHPRRVSRTPS